MIPNSQYNRDAKRILGTLYKGDVVVWDMYTQRVMKTYRKKFNNTGEIYIECYELPNISTKAIYNVWKKMAQDEIDYDYLKKCTKSWWNNLHWDGELNAELTANLRTTFNRRGMVRLTKQADSGTLQNLPRHLVSKRKQLFVNTTRDSN